MRRITLIFLFLISVPAWSGDSLQVKGNNGVVFARFGGVPSIFMLGYGHEFRTADKLSFGFFGGAGIDLFRYPPHYNFHVELKGRISYNFKRNRALIFELGSLHIFNPWYLKDPEKYFPECSRQRCPKSVFNHFIGAGYRHSFDNGLSLIGQVYLNRYDDQYLIPLPGFEVNYSFGKK